MLKTEMRNPATTHIDTMSAQEMVAIMQQENMNAAKAVEAACGLPVVLPREVLCQMAKEELKCSN